MVVEPLISRVDMHVERIPNTPVTSNCFVLHEPNSSECLIIDPGSDDNSTLLDYIKQLELSPKTIILTHEHFDHIWGVVGLTDIFTFELICSQVCANAIVNPKKNLSLFHDQVGFSVLNKVTSCEKLNNEFSWNGEQFKFIQTPGHSEGSISIQLDEMLFCGDLLIQDEKTVTKLPGGSMEKLRSSQSILKSRFCAETVVYSGHGDSFLFGDYFLYEYL